MMKKIEFILTKDEQEKFNKLSNYKKSKILEYTINSFNEFLERA